MKENNKPIGIFDSGLGGLTVLKELKQKLPNEKFIYFGDTAHVPYGNKSPEIIKKYCLEITSFLLLKEIKILIVACNSASSVALKEIENLAKIPVINVVDPCVIQANKYTQSNNIAIIGTETTIQSKAYQHKLLKLNPKIKAHVKSCPLFVPLIEEGFSNSIIAEEVCKIYLKEISNPLIDTVILGCTHYPLMLKAINNAIASNIRIINSAQTVATYVFQYLDKNYLANSQQKKHKIKDQYYVSDTPQKFDELASIFLNTKTFSSVISFHLGKKSAPTPALTNCHAYYIVRIFSRV